MKRRKRRKNPDFLTFGIFAKKGFGPKLHFDGKKFTNNGKAKGFATMIRAKEKALEMLRRFRLLQSYTVTVAPLGKR